MNSMVIVTIMEGQLTFIYNDCTHCQPGPYNENDKSKDQPLRRYNHKEAYKAGWRRDPLIPDGWICPECLG